MRGDILFFKGGQSFSDRLIQWRTHGPYVHVEIDLGDGTAIGSHWRTGVDRHPLSTLPFVRYRLPTPPDRIEDGIAWLDAHLGDPYGVLDILMQVITLIWPGCPVTLSQRRGFDCSDLVAEYVIRAGGLDEGSLDLARPDLVTPNDLARACGLLE